MELTQARKEEIKMLIRYFNFKAGAHYWFEPNYDRVNAAIEAANGDVGFVKNKFTEQIAKKNLDLGKVCSVIVGAAGAIPVEVKDVPVEQPAPAPVPVDNLTASMNVLGQVVTDLLARTKLDEIKDTVGAALREDVKKFITETYGPITRKVTVEIADRKVELGGVVHSKFDTVLKFVQANEPVFLTGPAGSGKNVLCQQVAKALGLKFYFSNAVTQEYKITGFVDAMGAFHESQFYKAFKNGGLFMLDEMDASIPEVLIILNAAIANRYFDFPAPIGYVEAHPDFRVVAAGNTFGNGADYDYVGRNQLDAASLDRFAQVRIDYDSHIEEGCANGDRELLGFCRAFRKATQKAGIRTVVSYRAISRMAKLSQRMEADELLDACLIKSLEVDDLNAISKDVQGYGKYTEGFNKVLANRK